MKCALAIVVLVGCESGSSGAQCDLEVVMTQDFISAEDCGHVAVDDGAGQMAARICVRDAIAASRPFRTILEVQGIDSHVARGYAGDGTALYEYAYDSFGGDSSQRWVCAMLADVAPCDGQTLANNLCLTCTQGVLDESSRCDEP